MTEHFGEYLKKRIIEHNLIWDVNPLIEGCTAEEIQEIMDAQGVQFLPRTYIEYLETLGKGTGGLLFRSEEVTYPEILTLKKEIIRSAQYRVENYGEEQLSADIFVILEHQGYAFTFFYTADRDDDPVLQRYEEGVGHTEGNVRLREGIAGMIDLLITS